MEGHAMTYDPPSDQGWDRPPDAPPGWQPGPPPGRQESWLPPPPPPGYGPPAGYGPPPGYGPAGYPPYPPGPYGGYPAPTRTDGSAIAALILSIASFVVCPVIPAVVALCLIPGSRAKIRSSGGLIEGEGLLTAAKIISLID